MVIGDAADKVTSKIALSSMARFVVNDRFKEGQSTSLVAAIDAVDEAAEAMVILLGDQPGIPKLAIEEIVAAWRRERFLAGRTVYEGGSPSHPVLLSRGLFDRARSLVGDVGARDLLSELGSELFEVSLNLPLPTDVDTKHDLAALMRANGV